MNRPTATLTTSCGDVPVTVSAVDFHQTEPLHEDGALNVTVKVREDGTISLVPNDTVAALVLRDLGLRTRVMTRHQGNGPMKDMTFLSLDLAPDRRDATLTKDGTRHTEMVISSADYEACRALLQQRYDERYPPKPKRTKAKTRRTK